MSDKANSATGKVDQSKGSTRHILFDLEAESPTPMSGRTYRKALIAADKKLTDVMKTIPGVQYVGRRKGNAA
ncbi:MAG: hypothetical protein O9342_00225 [Beijerinckiaceae bacterium]|nr:hypothetical protein [Beijerinckiaceae bacterium]